MTDTGSSKTLKTNCYERCKARYKHYKHYGFVLGLVAIEGLMKMSENNDNWKTMTDNDIFKQLKKLSQKCAETRQTMKMKEGPIKIIVDYITVDEQFNVIRSQEVR